MIITKKIVNKNRIYNINNLMNEIELLLYKTKEKIINIFKIGRIK